jgi:hypothetical protein
VAGTRPYPSLDELASELGRSRSEIEALIDRRELPPPVERERQLPAISRLALDAYRRRERGESAPVVHAVVPDEELAERFLERV